MPWHKTENGANEYNVDIVILILTLTNYMCKHTFIETIE